MEDQEWVGVVQAMKLTGGSRHSVEKLAESGRVQTKTLNGMERGKRYLRADLVAIKEFQEQPVPLIIDTGINPLGHVADWTKHRFIDRLDACWFFLMGHGYLSKEESEALRRRVAATIQGSGGKGNFMSCPKVAGEMP